MEKVKIKSLQIFIIFHDDELVEVKKQVEMVIIQIEITKILLLK
jgi:hypothetical protein